MGQCFVAPASEHFVRSGQPQEENREASLSALEGLRTLMDNLPKPRGMSERKGPDNPREHCWPLPVSNASDLAPGTLLA